MEPTLNQIEDYNGNESNKKRYTVYAVIGFLLALGIGYSMVKQGLDSDNTEGFIPYQYIDFK